MSYCRWSTVINPNLSFDEIQFLLINGVTWERIQKINSKGKSLSDWYIFHHTDSGDTKEEQYLAVWSRFSRSCPVLKYDTIKYMLETSDYTPLDVGHVTQEDFMRSNLLKWVQGVDEEYSDLYDHRRINGYK